MYKLFVRLPLFKLLFLSCGAAELAKACHADGTQKLFHNPSHVLICICGLTCDRTPRFRQEEGQHAGYHLLTETNGYISAYSCSSSTEWNVCSLMASVIRVALFTLSEQRRKPI